MLCYGLTGDEERVFGAASDLLNQFIELAEFRKKDWLLASGGGAAER